MRARARAPARVIADHDLVVVGGGAAGLTAAIVGATLGAKTVLVERDRLGGDCTWRGCVPSKALLHVASVAHHVRLARGFGMVADESHVAWPAVRAWLDDRRRHIYERADAPDVLARYGVRVVTGDATFLDARRLHVRGQSGDETLTARRFVICTGSEPVTLAGIACVTTDTVFDLPERPHRLLIVGGGPVAIELAQAFARLGSTVCVVSRSQTILDRDEPEHARVLQTALEGEGVRFRLGVDVRAATRDADATVVTLSDDRIERCDAIVAAIGRAPRVTGFGLETTGIALVNGAIDVDAYCRTNVPHIYATGDVAGPPYFTHAAEEMSKTAIAHGLLRLPKRYDRARVPWCTYTSPELAHVGLSARTLRERNTPFRTLTFSNDDVDRALVDGATAGGTRLFVSRRGRLLGASVLGARAGETAGELALAIAAKQRVARIADTVHPYPTYAYGARRAADGWYERALTPLLRRAIGIAYRFRGTPPRRT
ncbi:MAG: FAD-dependent oxidoreductase [Vulcanimicrobiaceae bacterium]